jgi:hypothetical protein
MVIFDDFMNTIEDDSLGREDHSIVCSLLQNCLLYPSLAKFHFLYERKGKLFLLNGVKLFLLDIITFVLWKIAKF